MIEVTRDDGVATVVLARPERRNALDLPMMQRLAGVLAEIAADPGARALILTGAGGVFCSGLDLGKMGESPTEPALERALVDEILVPLERLPVPTIAAMNGDAYAGGLELALHCDIRLAVNNARFGMPVARIGIVVPYPLILKLIDTVGAPTTNELLFSGEPLTAERAHQLAMVNRLTAPEELMSAAQSMARNVAANAPLAIRAMKQAILAGRTQRTFEAPADVRDAASRARQSEDAVEGLRAIAEKRRPVFRGR
jgi:enoyl-CoA hydratase/carnithine racemase